MARKGGGKMKGNRISRQLDEYLDYKHSLGFKLTHEESVLRNFANYTLDIGYSGSLNVEIVLSWIASGSKKNKTRSLSRSQNMFQHLILRHNAFKANSTAIHTTDRNPTFIQRMKY